MNRDDTSAGVEHLQNAAREMIAAARLFLDAAEEVVEDPQVVSELGGAVRGVVSDLARAADRRARNSRPFESDLYDGAEDEVDYRYDLDEDPDHLESDGEASSGGQSDAKANHRVEPDSPRSTKRAAGAPRVRRITVE